MPMKVDRTYDNLSPFAAEVPNDGEDGVNRRRKAEGMIYQLEETLLTFRMVRWWVAGSRCRQEDEVPSLGLRGK